MESITMENSFALILFLQGIIFGFFCSFVAKQKNRDSVGWFVIGFFFSLIALLALIAVPQLEKDVKNPNNRIIKTNTDLYNKPIQRISRRQKFLRFLIILLGLVLFTILVILLNKYNRQ